MEFDQKTFDIAIKEDNIVKHIPFFEKFIKTYLKIANESTPLTNE